MGFANRLVVRELALLVGLFIAQASGAADRCPTLMAEVESLVEHTWVDAKFSAAFLKQLHPIDDGSVVEEFGFDARAVHQAAEFFAHRAPGAEPLIVRHYLARRIESHGTTCFVVLFAMSAGEKLAGFLAITLCKEGEIAEAFSDYLKVDTSLPETRSLSLTYWKFAAQFFRQLGVTKERFEAGWAGRHLWARLGYGFDPEAHFSEDGVRLPQVELVRRNFARFLQYHGLCLADLVVRRNGRETEPLHSLNDLKTPADFIAIRHRERLTLQVRPYVDVDKLGEPVKVAPGKAFGLWDYRVRENQTVTVLQSDKPLSDIAFPTWIAIRDL